MSLIFVGSTVDRKTLKTLPDASIAGNKMQLGFIKGFVNAGIETRAISIEPYAMWHNNDRPIFVRKKHLRDEDAIIETVGYINFPVIKQITIILGLRRKLCCYLKREKYKDATIIVYNTMSILANPVLAVSKKKNLNSIAIIADLPIKFPKNIFRRLEDKRQQEAISNFTALIPLTKYIAQDFAPGIPYCVVEAGCNPIDYCEKVQKNFNSRTHCIVFSGTLNRLSGIELMINTMKQISNKSIELHIYGDGPLRDYVEGEVKEMKNTTYYGHVPNDQMLKIQKNADLLVCPRKADTFTTKYTFPSKVLEYICSGTPVLSNRLPGIPLEYENYINFPSSEKCADWVEAIEHIFSDENYVYYQTKAAKAKKIVLQKKSWSKQVKKIIDEFNKINIKIK